MNKVIITLAALTAFSAASALTPSANPFKDCQAISSQYHLGRVTAASGQPNFMGTLYAGQSLLESYRSSYGGEKVIHQKGDGPAWGVAKYNGGHSFYFFPGKQFTCEFRR